ncbi:hypothetical protein PCIT_b1173 [Pseudoalteromonas citrea]|uniref:Uncharacterized protein n=1 Tax=Pseudoalteromonas citrea TaxID=43655 RepID=A0AAD4AFJ7_9GAMM|nr:hypothetical protein PCIT_b1173 [Pseudoalteromonas citrea]
MGWLFKDRQGVWIGQIRVGVFFSIVKNDVDYYGYHEVFRGT